MGRYPQEMFEEAYHLQSLQADLSPLSMTAGGLSGGYTTSLPGTLYCKPTHFFMSHAGAPTTRENQLSCDCVRDGNIVSTPCFRPGSRPIEDISFQVMNESLEAPSRVES